MTHGDLFISLVTIESKEVVVYPDDLPDPKPKVGEKLNKPALVSMHEFWPKDKTTREFIKDEDRLERMNYAKKLKGMVAKIGGEYVDYKPDTGSCVFKVSHVLTVEPQIKDTLRRSHPL